ncbi:uncharacterized protein BDR25DRAFT_318464 [Lindgomyces ingoldianus]|uniref:Uncharacterized protein n=1 Tax=Lindgomyces ingoldianus TaxID=673940 RepID=A0ACB6QFB2_9PLEO|nr:uncharacterized protein BDR25DRAFT_318464 [Lindgomyces ingoldianus]KAF2465616.1 hypothetical protein BDR25DRAFT_318464 [Lindgomyces ingoldianus]
MEFSAPAHTAQRTCTQCKASKKKCDKVAPKCGRCLRLSINCWYPHTDKPGGAEPGLDGRDPRFDEVFRRLERIENQLPSTERFATRQSSVEQLSSQYSLPRPLQESGSCDWTLNPGSLKPHWMTFILYGSVLRVTTENQTTLEKIIHKYSEHTHRWLPIVSQARMERGIKDFWNIVPDPGFLMLVLAMHLLVTPVSEHPKSTSLSDSSWYRACKYHYGQYVSLGEPSIELVQVGILIALFEHMQWVEDRAFVTLGICARVAYALKLNQVASQQSASQFKESTPELEEMLLTWRGLILLDRYINMPPFESPRQPAVQQNPFQPSSLENVTNFNFISGFKSIDAQILEDFWLEVEASRMLAQVQELVRENPQKDSFLRARAPLVMRNIDELVRILKSKQAKSGRFFGLCSCFTAALQLQCSYIYNQGPGYHESIVQLKMLGEELKSVASECRLFNGFTENYLEGIRPAWISAAYLSMKAQNMFSVTEDAQCLIGTAKGPFMELLQGVAPRYRFAGLPPFASCGQDN